MPSNAVERDEAIRNLQSGQASIDALASRLTETQLEQPNTLAGGSWSTKDLLGHLAAWEAVALETLHAWRAQKELPTDGPWAGTDAFNAQVQEKTSRQSLADVRRYAAETHAALVQAIQSMSDDEWRSSRDGKTLGERLGGLTGGPAGDFRHAFDHVEDLQAFVQTAGANAV